MAVGSTTTRAGEAALERLRQWPGEHRVAVVRHGAIEHRGADVLNEAVSDAKSPSGAWPSESGAVGSLTT